MTAEEFENDLYLSFINSLDCPKGLIVSIDGTTTKILAYNRRNIVNRIEVAVGGVSLADKYAEKGLTQEKAMEQIAKEQQRQINPEGLEIVTQYADSSGIFQGLPELGRRASASSKDVVMIELALLTLQRANPDNVAEFNRNPEYFKAVLGITSTLPDETTLIEYLNLLEATVDVFHILKSNALPFQGTHHQTVNWPEIIFRKRSRTQAILVSHHHPFEIQFLTDKAQVPHHLGIEFQLLKRIDLVIDRRLNDERPVTIDEQHFLLHIFLILLH